jgi:hypothetical protein
VSGISERKKLKRDGQFPGKYQKGIEIGAEDAPEWLSGANKAMQAAPAAVAPLATLVGAARPKAAV